MSTIKKTSKPKTKTTQKKQPLNKTTKTNNKQNTTKKTGKKLGGGGIKNKSQKNIIWANKKQKKTIYIYILYIFIYNFKIYNIILFYL